MQALLKMSIWCLKLVARVTESYQVMTAFTSLSAADFFPQRLAEPLQRLITQTPQSPNLAENIKPPHWNPILPPCRERQSVSPSIVFDGTFHQRTVDYAASLTDRLTDWEPVLNTDPTRSGEVIACGGSVHSMSESNRKVKTDVCGRNI